VLDLGGMEASDDDWRARADDRAVRTADFLRSVDARAADTALGKLDDDGLGETSASADRFMATAPPARTRQSRFGAGSGGGVSRAPAPAPIDEEDDGEGWDDDEVGELLARRRALVEAAAQSDAATRIQAVIRGRVARKTYSEELEAQFEREQAEMDAAARRQVEEGLLLVER